MGMFDNVRINPDLLPVSLEEKVLLKGACEGEFQTKSLKKMLRIVEITDEGNLRWQDTDWLEFPKSRHSNLKTSEEGLKLLSNSLQQTTYRWVDEIDFTGEIRFYESVGDEWYEFCALYAEGKLLKIVKLSPK